MAGIRSDTNCVMGSGFPPHIYRVRQAPAFRAKGNRGGKQELGEACGCGCHHQGHMTDYEQASSTASPFEFLLIL